VVLIASTTYFIQLILHNPTAHFDKGHFVLSTPIVVGPIAIFVNLVYIRPGKKLTLRVILDFIADIF